MFELNHVSVNHGKKVLLHDINLTLSSGKITGLIGRNGAGKSTLLKIMAGLVKPSGGEIQFNQQTLYKWPQATLAQHIGYLSQKPHISTDFTVQEVVELGRYPYRHLSQSVNQEVVLHYLELFHLTGHRKQMYNSLSGGEQQRVHLARLLAQLHNDIDSSQKFLLLDEHMAHLDYHYQAQTFEYFKELAKQGFGLLIVSHDITTLSRYADQMHMVKEGKLEAITGLKQGIDFQQYFL